MTVLMMILSGLEGGMPSTCSSQVAALFSLPFLCLDGILGADDFSPHEQLKLYNISEGTARERLVWIRERQQWALWNSLSWYFRMIEILT